MQRRRRLELGTISRTRELRDYLREPVARAVRILALDERIRRIAGSSEVAKPFRLVRQLGAVQRRLAAIFAKRCGSLARKALWNCTGS